jgi:Kef-type K+ transport system membrane component KefB/nucleotide-binding universal stress UspA family protein
LIQTLNEPIAIFLVIMAVILITPILSEKIRLPGIVGIILGGMLIGPHGINLLTIDGSIEFLATVGLVYLMFNAGLEVDIHQFKRVRSRAVIFGLLTYMLPQLLGIGLGRLLGLSWLGSVLLGSAFSSHTLIAFPIVTRLGVTRNEAVGVTAGATVMTDISAFLVLAVVLGINEQSLRAGFFVQLLALLAVYTVLLLFGLPRLGKFFFRRFTGRAVEFQFVLVILLVSALAAMKIGVHEVVGAFLAGLAINATLPRHSPVIGHVLFIGESLFIPIFLLYSGMLTDPLVFLQGWDVILIGIGVTAVAYISKFLAAWITARIFHYSRAEFWTAFGLSHAQAAVTIPTLVIGLEIGLFSTELFNAAIIMILFTSITSPLVVQHFAPSLTEQTEEEEPSPLFSRVLVPIANPQTQENLVTLGGLLASAQKGKLMVLHVVSEMNGGAQHMQYQREILNKVPEILNDPDLDLQLIPRVDQSYAKGILRTAVEQDASIILMGWRGKAALRNSLMGTVLDEVVWGTSQPVLVCKLSAPINSMQRVVVVIPSQSLQPVMLGRTLETVVAISNAVNVPALILVDKTYEEKIAQLVNDRESDQPIEVNPIKGNMLRRVLEIVNESDMIVMPSSGSRKQFLTNLGDLPERLAQTTAGNVIVLHYPQ